MTQDDIKTRLAEIIDGKSPEYAAEQIMREFSVTLGWQPMSMAPKDGTLIDVWCSAPNSVDFRPDKGGIRLTEVAWHTANEAFPHTGWVRLTDDGHYDLVDGPPISPIGLPRWIPVLFMIPPNPPAADQDEIQTGEQE